MTETDIVNVFLAREATSDLERNLQMKCKDLYSLFSSLGQELQVIRQNLQAKELEWLQTKNQLEAYYSLILSVESPK